MLGMLTQLRFEREKRVFVDHEVIASCEERKNSVELHKYTAF